MLISFKVPDKNEGDSDIMIEIEQVHNIPNEKVESVFFNRENSNLYIDLTNASKPLLFFIKK